MNANTEEIARQLEELGWSYVAADVREGVPLEVVTERVRDIAPEAGDVLAILAAR